MCIELYVWRKGQIFQEIREEKIDPELYLDRRCPQEERESDLQQRDVMQQLRKL